MLGERIAALRRQAGMSQAELAKRLSVSPSAVGMYEQGRREPSLSALLALARQFDVTADFLLSGQPVTDKDAQMLSATFFTEEQRRRTRLLCGSGRLSPQELALLVTAMLTQP